MITYTFRKGWWFWINKPGKKQWAFFASPNRFISFNSWKIKVGKF